MFGALTILHVIVAITLVLIVLLQTGRGAELGAAFGGMGQATYGRGQSTFISKLTTVLAIIFMTTSLTLAFITTERPKSSLLEGTPAPAQTTTQPAAPAEEAPAQEEGATLPQTDAPPQPSAPQH